MNATEDIDTRNLWWNELRLQLNEKVLLLGGNYIWGYKESTCIRNDVVILSAYGTVLLVEPNNSPKSSCEKVIRFIIIVSLKTPK